MFGLENGKRVAVEQQKGENSALTMRVLVLVMASVAGVVLRALLLMVAAAAAAAAKHLVKEAELGVGEGKEGQKSY